MKTKDQVLEKFKKFEAMVTNMTEKIKILRSDNSGVNTHLKNFPIILKKREFSNSLVYLEHLSRMELQRE